MAAAPVGPDDPRRRAGGRDGRLFPPGFPLLDAVYQTVTTVTTVGFREVHPLSRGGQVFTIVLILIGVGTALYNLTLVIQAVVEGELAGTAREAEDGTPDRPDGATTSLCAASAAWAGARRVRGPIGRDAWWSSSGTRSRAARHRPLPVVGATPPTTRCCGKRASNGPGCWCARSPPTPTTSSSPCRAGSCAPTCSSWPGPGSTSSEAKLLQAGADRVVNPQSIGGKRMAAFVLQPHVAEFLDVVMHDGSLEFRLEEVRRPAAARPWPAAPCGTPTSATQTGALDPGHARRRTASSPPTRRRRPCSAPARSSSPSARRSS